MTANKELLKEETFGDKLSRITKNICPFVKVKDLNCEGEDEWRPEDLAPHPAVEVGLKISF